MNEHRAYYNEWEKYPAHWLRRLAASGYIAEGHVDERSIEVVAPEDVRGFRECHFFAGIGIWSYALQLAGWPTDYIRTWTGSCPCFVAGTLILTARGFVPIEQMRIGDLVLTHKNRWRPVTATMQSRKQTRVLKGQGHWGLETTDEHPFLTPGDKWVEASEMAGKRWSCVTNFEHPLPIPPLGERMWRGQVQVPNFGTSEFWMFVGYWLGNGWTRNSEQVVVCGHQSDGPVLEKLATDAGLHGSLSIERTSARLRIGSKLFAQWLDDHFGRYAATKRIPAWLLSAPEEVVDAFVRGLVLADGHSDKGAWHVTTTSREIAVGTRILVNRLGFSASVLFKKPKRQKCIIEGREVNERGFFRVSFRRDSKSFKIDDQSGWGLVRTSEATSETKEVFNIAVDEDESYVADGITVHNCQPFSSAGKGKGLEDERHLWPAWFKLIDAERPDAILGEQSSAPAGLEWFDVVSADLERAGYTVGAVDSCSAGVGAPHIRQRLYFVAYAKELRWPEGWNGRAGARLDEAWKQFERHGDARGLADAVRAGWAERRTLAGQRSSAGGGLADALADAARVADECHEPGIGGAGDRAPEVDRRGASRQSARRSRADVVADADGGGRAARRVRDGGAREEGSSGAATSDGSGAELVADADGERLEGERLQLRERGPRQDLPEAPGRGEARGVVDAAGLGRRQDRLPAADGAGADAGREADQHRHASAAHELGDAAGLERASDRAGRVHQAQAAYATKFGDRDGTASSSEARELGDAGRERGGRHAGAVPRAEAEGERERFADRDVGDEPRDAGTTGDLGNAGSAGLPEQLGVGGVAPGASGADEGEAAERAGSPTAGLWGDAVWLYCRDGKYRPTESRFVTLADGHSVGVEYLRPLVVGAEGRVGKIKAYGNAINALQAATFVRAARDSMQHLWGIPSRATNAQ